MKRTVLITGASSGIGKETAKLFVRHGFEVIAAARRAENMKDLQELGCDVYSLDVTNEASIQRAFGSIYKSRNNIDILVNNAGFCQNGFVEELTIHQMKYQFDVNVFGLIRITQMVLPGMREAGTGHIINIGSAGGDFTSPGAGAYHASKYALESFTDAMRQELKSFGIHVSLIKPGGVKTAFVNNSKYPEPIAGNPYNQMRENFIRMLENILKASNSAFPILKAEEVAEAILRTAQSSLPRTRVKVGRTAKMMPVMKGLLSDKAFDKMIMNQLKLTQEH